MKPFKSLIAGIALSLVGVSAHAAMVSNEGDLILSFYTSNPASVGATAYEVNLGSATNYRNNPASGTIVNLNADLTTAFGALWASNTEMKMALVTGWSSTATPPSPDAARTIYYGQKAAAGTTGSVTSIAPTVVSPMSTTAYNGWATSTSGWTAGQDFADGGATVSNSAIITIADTPNDVTNFVSPTTPGVYWGKPFPTTAIGDYGNGYVFAMDLWVTDQATKATGTFLGTYGLTSSGDFVAIPEPSTMALLALGGIAGVIALRRRQQSNS